MAMSSERMGAGCLLACIVGQRLPTALSAQSQPFEFVVHTASSC